MGFGRRGYQGRRGRAAHVALVRVQERDAGAGAPRFSVSYEGEAGYHFFSALYGTQKPAGAGWTNVEFSATTPYCDGVTATPTGCFGTTPVDDLFLVQDEEGTAVLRNIEVNGVTIDKFPNG